MRKLTVVFVSLVLVGLVSGEEQARPFPVAQAQAWVARALEAGHVGDRYSPTAANRERSAIASEMEPAFPAGATLVFGPDCPLIHIGFGVSADRIGCLDPEIHPEIEFDHFPSTLANRADVTSNNVLEQIEFLRVDEQYGAVVRLVAMHRTFGGKPFSLSERGFRLYVQVLSVTPL